MVKYLIDNKQSKVDQYGMDLVIKNCYLKMAKYLESQGLYLNIDIEYESDDDTYPSLSVIIMIYKFS